MTTAILIILLIWNIVLTIILIGCAVRIRTWINLSNQMNKLTDTTTDLVEEMSEGFQQHNETIRQLVRWANDIHPRLFPGSEANIEKKPTLH